MIKATVLFLSTLATALFLSTSVVYAEELAMPEIHATIALQLETYRGGDNVIYSSQIKDAREAFLIRHASLEAIGQLGDYIEYNIEMGTVVCQGELKPFQITEAGLFYRPFTFLKVGFMQGHIMRGFTLGEECIEQISSEKPRFCKTITPCHPTGAVLEIDYDIDETMGIRAQFAYLNGVNDGTINNEHDINYSMIFRTPVAGLSIGGFYNDLNWEAFDNGEGGYKSYEGHRIGFGFDYDAYNVRLRSEYYHGRGFGGGPADSVKMGAFVADVAYKINTGQKQLTYLQPYITYQWWDMGSNLGGNDANIIYARGEKPDGGDHVCSYLAFGVCLGLGLSEAKLRIEYEMPLSFPDDEYGRVLNEDDEASCLLVRLQVGI